VRVLIAPDSFAGTMTAVEAAHAIEQGWRQTSPDDEIVLRPMSDGGPGFVDVVAEALGGKLKQVSVTDPAGDEVPAEFALVGDTAYVEVAQACGVHLVPEADRDPEHATSFGVGQLIKAAVRSGSKRIVVGLGGTATNDAGAGALAALGATADGPLDAGGFPLRRVKSVDLQPAIDALAGVELIAATDVDNPLLGLRGCSRNYAPQKGATEEQVMRLEGSLENFHEVIGRRSDGKDPAVALGAGAGGGIGYALLLLGAKRVPGISTVMDIVRLPDLVTDSDLIITGEGRFDWQSLRGKVVSGVSSLALANAKPCVVIAGDVAVGRREFAGLGVAAAYSAADHAGGVDKAMAAAEQSLTDVSARVARTWSASQRE
jgi:glycerate 2-kinase